jgi:hypothetical protein
MTRKQVHFVVQRNFVMGSRISINKRLRWRDNVPMRSVVTARIWLIATALFFSGALVISASAQQLAKRLILKDGSYQLATKYETKGDRVRYLSAERGEWEEVPKSMVDWDATDKYEKDRANGEPPPEAVTLEKEFDAERKADEAKAPQVAPGLHLPELGGVELLDTYQGQPQLADLEQNGGEINTNRKNNVLRAAINPIASARQSVELPGLHAKVQSHATLPAIYVNVQPLSDSVPATTPSPAPELPWDRFKIVRAQVQTKDNKRVIGTIKIAITGKTSQEQTFIPTTAEKLTGGWVKVTPKAELAPGEYAVIEMLGKEGMNLYAWDFGVNPAAPENMVVTKPDAPAAPVADKTPELTKRPK